ncbi:membrane protein [Alishewanella longhuensis]|uniref:Membrane protein n=1 Tax=Alishewanella longhuensis TaxID=1091037 RepID=A0ABQ3L444_9ALTE|nr:M1 family aminopeptidase [Alishewanella longhuensis]GHG72536.1 membrane protein [Alishewanella longhuensis]
MFTAMLRFELRYFLRQPSFYVVCLLLFLVSFLATVSNAVVIGGGGEVFKNSPHTISAVLLTLGIFAMFLVVNFVGSSALRNSAWQMEELVHSKPLQPLPYQLGRFFGSYLVVVLVFAAVPLGILLGSFMPWVDASRFGATRLVNYWQPFMLLSVPNLFILSALFYAMARKFRSMMALYLTAVLLLVLYIIAGNFASLPEYRELAALLDPFALRTYNDVTRYWTIIEKNEQLVSLTGQILQNRTLWLAVALVLLAVSGLFRMPSQAKTDKAKGKKVEAALAPPALSSLQQKAVGYSLLPPFLTRLGFEIRQVLFTAPFLILGLITIVNLVGPMFDDFGWYGTSSWPLTQSMVFDIQGAMSIIMIVVAVYYCAEVVWRERSSGMGDIIDSLPVPNLTFWLTKYVAVALVMALLYLLAMLTTIGFQLIKGIDNLELSQYAIRLGFFTLLPFMLTVTLAFFLQVISPNKYVGMGLFVGYYLTTFVMMSWGFGHSMYNFGMSPVNAYSDLNGYGWTLYSHSWYMLYWGAFSLMLFIIGYGLYHRGPAQPLRSRIRQLSYQLGTKGFAALGACALVFVLSGAFLFQQTRVVNQYQTAEQLMDLQADYEKEFKALEAAPTLITTNVMAYLDLYPAERQLNARVEFTWQNKSSQPISKLLVNWPANTKQLVINIAGAELSEADPHFRVSWLHFAEPIAPGAILTGEISLQRRNQGIKENNIDYALVENGTFINNWELLPSFGYQNRFELNDRHERQKRGLAPRARANKLEDESFYQQNFFGPDGDFIEFEAVVSTAADQIALVPGYLQRQWREGERQFFHYKMDKPMVNFYSISSGRYEVAREQHNGVNIEVYYHAGHPWNIARMIESVRDSLDYFSAEFGPYQHQQMRIIEFPGYRGFAQSFANTVPYSEQIGFITDLRNPDNIDPVYYVTAHEVAHQWFGHQVGAANVQGSAVISESLSQYAAIMVLEHKYGAANIRKFIRHELDGYLRGRSAERMAEMPLLRSEEQSYIHYQKGSVVMMAIRDLLGEARLNANLRAFTERYRYRNDPFPTTLDLVAYLKRDTTAAEAAFIDDQFNQITLYDLRLQQASATELADGRYQINLTIHAAKLQADEQGRQQEVPMQQEVTVALFSQDPDKVGADSGVLHQQKYQLVSGSNQLQLEVDTLPAFAGVDPFITLIDRDSADNIRRISR